MQNDIEHVAGNGDARSFLEEIGTPYAVLFNSGDNHSGAITVHLDEDSGIDPVAFSENLTRALRKSEGILDTSTVVVPQRLIRLTFKTAEGISPFDVWLETRSRLAGLIANDPTDSVF